MYKLIRITTVPISLQKLIAGQMKFMGKNGFKVIMISSDFNGKDQLETKENAEYISVEMTRKISPFKDLISLFKMINTFRKVKPTIVHTHTPKAGLLGMIAAKLTAVPVRLHTVAGLPLMETKGFKRRVLELVEQLTYACATKVYPNSASLKEFIIHHNFTESDKLKVIGNGSSNGINTADFKKSPEITQKANDLAKLHGIKSTDFVFIFVGRLVKDKGIEELVRAFHLLSQNYPALKLILVGPKESELDPLSASCLQIIKENKKIISVGYQNDVRPYLALSNVLAFPSYREGFPNVPMQAGCFDLPCIVTNINGCNEIIVEGENGLIIPVKDEIALRSAMEKLYTEKEAYTLMCFKARKLIVDRYEQEKIWALILEEYKSHLNHLEIV